MEDNLVPVTGMQNEIFTPKIYKVPPGETDSGKDYEIMITALLAVKCCSEELQHFWLAANVDGFDAMYNIVMFKKMKENDQGTTYFMQLKHQDASKPIVKDLFLSSEGDYSLKKYFHSYVKMKNAIDNVTQKTDMIKHLRLASKMVFIIFTNKGATVDSQILHKVNNAPQLDSIQVKGDIFKFDHTTLADDNMDFLKKLFLFTDQPHIKDMDNEIKSAVKILLHPLQLSDVDLTDITDNVVSFVDAWTKGLLSGHYPLTKTHILKKLAELLLLPYIFKLREPGDNNNYTEDNKEDDGEENLWYNFTRDKDVTIIDDVDDVVQRYILNSTYSILRNRKRLQSVTAINKELLRVIRNPENMSKNDRYELLWKTREIPLLLQVSDSQGVKHIQEILNRFAGIFRVIILNKTKIHLELFQASKPFTNITDLNKQHQEFILQLPVKLQGRLLSSIQILNIDKSQFYESLKVKDIVYILCGQFNIGSQFEELPPYFVDVSLTRIILDIKVLEIVQRDTFVVKCKSCSNFKALLIRQSNMNENQILQWEHLNKINFESKIIIYESTENVHEIEEYCGTLQKTIHFLIWRGNGNLEWIKSSDTIENLRRYEKPLESVTTASILAKEALVHICQYKKPLLVSANPGMGKSVLINYLAHNIPVNLWVLKVTLAKYKDEYNNWKKENSPEINYKYMKQFFKRVINEEQISNCIISYLVFKQYLNSKNVAVLLDGFDEVPVNCQDGAKELIKFINKSGYYMCVTTRPILKNDLASLMNTFAVTLNSFTIDEQMCFLTNYFANIGKIGASESTVTSYVLKLLKAARKNLNDMDNRFLGIPLQTALLTQVFANDFIKYLEDETFRNQYFDLIYLYKHFINEKIKIAFDKVEGISEDMIYQCKLCNSFYALRHLFLDKDLEDLQIDNKLKLVIKLLPHIIQIIEKGGLIVIDCESKVSFAHQTYAEFLAADWLAENIKTSYKAIVLKLIKKTFDPSFLVLRNMFDRILARNCPLHTAIINRQVNRAKEIIISDENALSAIDAGGRTCLHLIAAWGLHHPHHLRKYIEAEMVNEDEMMIILELIPNNKLTHTEDHLLNYTPLEYALLSRSLSIANRICSEVTHPNCCIDITKSEADTMLDYADKYYSISLYMLILRCRIRTDFELHFQSEYDHSNVHNAISRGDIENVHSLISRRTINLQDTNGCTPLHTAAKYGQTEITKYLLSRKANVNRIDNLGRSALHWASYQGHVGIMTFLIANGIKIDTTDCYNRTALHYALLCSSTEKCHNASLLIELNSRKDSSLGNTTNFLDIKDVHNMNALHWATQLGLIEIINLLLSKGVDVNAKGRKGMTAVFYAVENNDINAIEALVTNGADIEAKDVSNQSSLHFAALKGHTDLVKLLVSMGADIETKNKYNQSPLHFAVRRAYKDVVNVLLNQGANIETKDEDDETPLHVAALRGNKDVVNLLLAKGSDIEAKNSINETPLHVAVRGGHEDVVRVLLNNGANVEAKHSYDETTPLHMAALRGNKEVVRLLLDSGAKIDAKNFFNRTPLHLAVREGHKDVVSVLLNN